LAPKRQYDIVVVGAGLAGLAAVIGLRGAGLQVAVVDSVARIDGARMKWGHDLQPNGLAALDALGLLGEVKRLGAVHDAYRLERLGGGPLSHWDYALLDHRFRYAVCIRTHVLRELLRETARRLEFVDMRIPATFTALERTDRGHAVTIASGDGGTEDLHARLVVAADGPRSRVREAAGIRARFRRGRRHWLDVIMSNPDDRIRDGYVYLGRGEYLGLVPTRKGELVAFHLTSTPDLRAYKERIGSIERFRETYAAMAPVLEAPVRSVESWDQTSHTPGHSMRAERWVTDGLLLLGDSAVTVNPITSQGACLALEEGVVLAEVLRGCFRKGDLSAAALAPYESRCRTTAQEMQEMGDTCTFVFGTRLRFLNWLKLRMLARIDDDPQMKYRILAYFSGMEPARIGYRDGLAAAGLWPRWRRLPRPASTAK
jgi:monooxygenase